MKFAVTTSNLLSSSLRNLAWDVFFASKGRGVTFEKHFPWTCRVSESITYFEAIDSEETCGGLVLREIEHSVDGRLVRIGMIGLVCVVEHMRGKGMAGALITEAIAIAKQRNLHYLTLWTGQPDVYARHGFIQHDHWLYGTVTAGETPRTGFAACGDEISVANANSLALPPFGNEIRIFSRGGAAITVVYDGDRATLADYHGPADEVCELLMQVLPLSWRLNIRTGDPLLEELEKNHMRLELGPVNLQMWCRIAAETVDFRSLNIKMLDRI